jgi:hypothetical protein
MSGIQEISLVISLYYHYKKVVLFREKKHQRYIQRRHIRSRYINVKQNKSKGNLHYQGKRVAVSRRDEARVCKT